MTEIVSAESDFLNECNKEFGCIAGIGPSQFVQSTFDTYCKDLGEPPMIDVYNQDDNIQCLAKMVSKKRYSHWYYYSGDIWFPKLSPKLQREVFAHIDLDCSCVEYVRGLSDYQPAKVINAIDIPVTQIEPVAGAWVLFNYNHVGFVRNVGTSTIDVWDEGEYNGRCITTRKTYQINDPDIRGYYY